MKGRNGEGEGGRDREVNGKITGNLKGHRRDRECEGRTGKWDERRRDRDRDRDRNRGRGIAGHTGTHVYTLGHMETHGDTWIYMGIYRDT